MNIVDRVSARLAAWAELQVDRAVDKVLQQVLRALELQRARGEYEERARRRRENTPWPAGPVVDGETLVELPPPAGLAQAQDDKRAMICLEEAVRLARLWVGGQLHEPGLFGPTTLDSALGLARQHANYVEKSGRCPMTKELEPIYVALLNLHWERTSGLQRSRHIAKGLRRYPAELTDAEEHEAKGMAAQWEARATEALKEAVEGRAQPPDSVSVPASFPPGVNAADAS